MKTKNETVKSRDLYELAFFITKTACKIESIEVTEELGKPACVVTITGENLKQLQLDYLNNHAPVDAISYRKSLSYIRTLVYGQMNKSRNRGAIHE
jgi:hypothetical protein